MFCSGVYLDYFWSEENFCSYYTMGSSRRFSFVFFELEFWMDIYVLIFLESKMSVCVSVTLILISRFSLCLWTDMIKLSIWDE